MSEKKGFVTTDQIEEVFEEPIKKFDKLYKKHNDVIAGTIAFNLNKVLNELLIKASENEEADNETD